MKKFLATLLCLAMLLCIVPLSATAADIAEADTTVATTPTGTAITTLAELQAITGDGDYYLANDIYVDLSTVTKLPLIPDGFTGTLDGKGYSILFKNADGTMVNSGTEAATNEVTLSESNVGVLFGICAAKSVKNLTLGSADAHAIAVSEQANSGIFAALSSYSTQIENVTVYGDITAGRLNAMNRGLFYAKTANNVKFKNCTAIGSIDLTVQKWGVNKKFGGFVGTHAGEKSDGGTLTVTFENCISDVTIGSSADKTSKVAVTFFGGILGHLDCLVFPNAAVFKNCVTMQTPALINENSVLEYYGYTYGVIQANTTTDVFPDSHAKAGETNTNDTVTPDNATNQVTLTNCIDGTTLATDLALTTERVAGIRFYDPTGIRFLSSVSATYDNLVAVLGADNVKLGTLIAPKAYVDNAAGFTMADLDALDVETAYVTIDYKADEWYDYTGTEGANYYTGAIADIKEANYEVNYCGIGYVSYTLDGNTWTTVYADYAADADGSTAVPAFNIRDLAEAAVADSATNPDKYTAAQLEALQKYLPADAE